MQYGDLPLLIVFLAALYLTAIYAILKLVERHPQEDKSSSATVNTKQ